MELFRIRKLPKGYIVEVKTPKWSLFGIKYVWKPYVKSAGLDCAWHHKSYGHAFNNLISEVKHSIEQ